MRYLSTITPSDMRNINRTAIMKIIHTDGAVSRSAITRKLGISLPSVVRIIDDLIDENLVRLTEDTEWSGGRRRPLVELNAENNLTIGIDMGGTKLYGAVADLGGKILYEKTLPKHNTTGEDSFVCVANLVEDLLAFSKTTGKIIRGIGAGVPGVTYHETGVIQWAPSLKWQDFPLKDRLIERFQMPVVVDNDVNLSALGEMWFGAGQNVDDMALIAIGTGIGAGIILNGSLYRGSHQAAGEIGYIIPGREYLGKDYPEFGPLETLVAGVGLSLQAREALKGKLTQQELDNLSGEFVCDAFRKNEDWAIPIIHLMTDYLTIAIASVSALFDPEIIVLGGGVSKSADLFIDHVRENLAGKVPFPPEIMMSKLGAQATVLGAVTNLLYNTSNFYFVSKLS